MHGQKGKVKKMGMINLKPCPFCGSERVKLFTYSTGGICVKCYDCCCQTGAFSDSFSDDATTVSAAERVVKAWNKRKWIDEEAIEKKCQEHYRQGREDEASLREGRLMQSFNPD